MEHFHAVVWMDHDEAHVIHFNPDETDELIVHSKHRKERLHPIVRLATLKDVRK
jgi:hypothetical protein